MSHKSKKSYINLFRGFTLLELLISVAVIGLLAAITIAALTSAKDKGAKAAIQQIMTSMRSEAGLYHAAIGNFGTATGATSAAQCTTANTLFVTGATPNLYKLLADLAKKNGAVLGTDKIICSTIGNPATAWAVIATTSETGVDWCVDSSGQSKAVTGAAGINTTTGVCK